MRLISSWKFRASLGVLVILVTLGVLITKEVLLSDRPFWPELAITVIAAAIALVAGTVAALRMLSTQYRDTGDH